MGKTRIPVSKEKLYQTAYETYLEAQEDGAYRHYHVVEVHCETGVVSHDIFANGGTGNEGWIQVAVFRFCDDDSIEYVPSEFDPDGDYPDEVAWQAARQQYEEEWDYICREAAHAAATDLVDKLEIKYPQFVVV